MATRALECEGELTAALAGNSAKSRDIGVSVFHGSWLKSWESRIEAFISCRTDSESVIMAMKQNLVAGDLGLGVDQSHQDTCARKLLLDLIMLYLTTVTGPFSLSCSTCIRH